MPTLNNTYPISLAALIMKLSALDLDRQGNVQNLDELASLHDLAQKVSISLGRMVEGVSAVIYHAQAAAGSVHGLGIITTCLGSTIESVARIDEVIVTAQQTKKWPCTPEGHRGLELDGCLAGLPHSDCRHGESGRADPEQNLAMMELVRNAAHAICEVEIVNLRCFTNALDVAYPTGEIEGNLGSVIRFIAEWTSYIEVLTEVVDDTSFDLDRLSKQAA